MSYLATEKFNHDWSREQLVTIVEMWCDGKSVSDISVHLNRDCDELGLLIMDLRELKPLLLPFRSHGFEESKPVDKNSKYKATITRLINASEDGVYRMFSFLNVNFHWNNTQLSIFNKLWCQKKSIAEIADKLERSAFEVMILIVDKFHDFSERLNSRYGFF